VYDPKGSSAKQLTGHSWRIHYGDDSGADGQVYIDKVAVGELSVPNQAVEAATNVSSTFTRDNANDGLLGLGFSKMNTIKPTKQSTWFDNIRPMLAAPVWTANLKRRQVGTYDFGYIDKAKYKGDIHWVKVKDREGYWGFETTSYQIGDKPETSTTINAIIDTGTSLWYLPYKVANAYWAAVPGASYNTLQAGFTFPCASKLPDFALNITGRRFVVPGINMYYQSISQATCYGGIQRNMNTNMKFSIFGDVFLKGMFVAFEAPVGGPPRLGFAPQTLPNS
jgi:aspergillopepsin I